MIKICPNAIDKLIVVYENLKNENSTFLVDLAILNDFLDLTDRLLTVFCLFQKLQSCKKYSQYLIYITLL